MRKGQTMKMSIAIVVIGCCVLGSVWAMAAGQKADSSPSEIEKLKDRVKTLEDKVAAMEKQLQVSPRVPRALPLPQFPRSRQAPDSWLPREFNGIPYYVIPLEQDPNRMPPRK